MRATEPSVSGEFELALSLPEIAIARSGAQFRSRENPWSCQDGCFRFYIDFDRVPLRFRTLVPALQRTLLVFAKTHALCSVSALFEDFLSFLRRIDQPGVRGTSIGLPEIQQFVSKLQGHEIYRIGRLNPLLQKWFALGLPGVDEDCVKYLRARRKPGSRKGNFVRTHDPEQGPFTEQEYTLLYRALDSGYGAKLLEMWAFVLARLLFATGQRISQYASMKLCDLHVGTNDQGRRSYSVNIPHLKTRAEHSRKFFQTFDLTPQTGELLLDYTSTLRLQGYADEAPLFPSPREHAGQGLFRMHCTGGELSVRFRKAVAHLVPVTDRLDGADLPVPPRRFRYTFGTRMAEEGCSPTVIANRLGHSDLQNVMVYVESTAKIVDNIDKAMSAHLAPIAQAFRGRLVENEASSTLAGASGTRIYDFKSAKAGVGSCGKDGGCAFNKPVACYTCFKFEPWLDAPHERLLERLLREREKHLEDPRIAAVNDDAILAIREVIAECEQVRAQRATGSDR